MVQMKLGRSNTRAKKTGLFTKDRNFNVFGYCATGIILCPMIVGLLIQLTFLDPYLRNMGPTFHETFITDCLCAGGMS
jgi:hypothetical protein